MTAAPLPLLFRRGALDHEKVSRCPFVPEPFDSGSDFGFLSGISFSLAKKHER
jgi:hypothetical protein